MPETLVIKIGGGEGIDIPAVAAQAAPLVRAGVRIVLVHGGSHETNSLAQRLGAPSRFLTRPRGHTSRRSDREALDIFTMAYCGRVNKAVVERLRASGVDAVGLSGIDGGLWTASRKDSIRAIEDGRTVIIRDDLSGRVESVDARLLDLLLADGRTPVLCPPAITPDGLAVNVDADRAAAATAVALRADALLLLSNVAGVLADPSDPSSLIADAGAVGAEALRAAAKGRMKNKVLAAEEAIAGGVGRVVIGSARLPDAGARARAGAGTLIEGARA